jgi:hypothetical protein
VFTERIVTPFSFVAFADGARHFFCESDLPQPKALPVFLTLGKCYERDMQRYRQCDQLTMRYIG